MATGLGDARRTHRVGASRRPRRWPTPARGDNRLSESLAERGSSIWSRLGRDLGLRTVEAELPPERLGARQPATTQKGRSLTARARGWLAETSEVAWREGSRGTMKARFIPLRVRPANIGLRRPTRRSCPWPGSCVGGKTGGRAEQVLATWNIAPNCGPVPQVHAGSGLDWG